MYKEYDLFDTVSESIDRSVQVTEKAKQRLLLKEKHKISKMEKHLISKATAWVKTLKMDSNEKYNYTRKTLKKLVLDIFYLELSSFSVFSELSRVLASEGANVENFDTRLIEKHLDKFKEIYLVYHLYHQLGMGYLADDMVQSIIYGERKDKTPAMVEALKQLTKNMIPEVSATNSVKDKLKPENRIKPKKLTFQDLHQELNRGTNATEDIS